MAEITSAPTELSKVIPVSFKINDVNSMTTGKLQTGKQFNTSDTDAWIEFTLEGLSASGTYDLTLINLDEAPDNSIFKHTDLAFSGVPFHYKLDSGPNMETNEIRHAGRWLGQIVVRMENGDTTSRQFVFSIAGHILDGKVAQVVLLEDYNALIATINTSKDLLAQYNVDYAALLVDLVAAETARTATYNQLVADQQANIEAFDVALDDGIVAANLAEKLEDFEEINNSRLLSAEQQLAEKADIADLPSSAYTFKGSTTFAALPTTENTLGDVRYVTDGTPQNYAWTGTAWTPIGNGAFANGTVTNQKLADGAVDLVKTTFKKMGKNIFNKATTLVDKYLDSNGGIMTLNGYYLSDFITVTPSVNYAFQKVRAVSWYTAEKVHISQSTMYDVSSIKLAPSNASFMKIGLLAASLNLAQVEKSDSVTAYENFKYVIPTDYTEKHTLVLNDIPDGSITTKKTAFAEVGKNKFDKDAITLGFYVNHTSGNLATSTSYDVSDYISVVSGASYALSGLISGAVRIAFYNTNKIFISGLYPLVNPIVIPANAVYARFSFTKGYAPTVQFENSDTPTVYESFGYKFTKEIISADTYQPEEFLAFLPSEICVAVGRTIELYNAQVAWCGNINNYHFKWDCTVGKAMKRKFSVTGVTIGTYPLTLTIYDNNMNAVFTDTSTVKVVSNVIATPKTILPIGDSLTNAKPWLGELRTLSGNQYTLVGTRGTAPLKHEGRSGFSAGSYLAATAYTFESEGVHPFWDGTRFNWAYYKTQTGITPDAVEIFLGTNGMALDPTVNANNIKQIVDYIRQDDATIPIHLVYTLYRGNQDGIGAQTSVEGYSVNQGAWKLQEDRKVFNLMVRLNELLNAYTNLYFIPVSLAHDSEFNFGATSTPVNPRASQTELLPTEATHPQNQGYYQIADITFSVMAAH